MPANVYYRLDRDVSPLKDHILIHNMEQGDKLTKSGIIITDDNGTNRGIRPRWAQVYKVGSNIDYVKEGEWILIEHGRWTFGVPMELTDGEETREIYLQRVDVEGILGVSSEKPSDI
ncbi:Chaperonin 10 Kd subunit [compost metagenome]